MTRITSYIDVYINVPFGMDGPIISALKYMSWS
jgi:hypothetical protein